MDSSSTVMNPIFAGSVPPMLSHKRPFPFASSPPSASAHTPSDMSSGTSNSSLATIKFKKPHKSLVSVKRPKLSEYDLAKPKIDSALHTFRKVSAQEITKLLSLPGYNQGMAFDHLVSKMVTHSIADRAHMFTQKEVATVMEMSGMSEEASVRALHLRAELHRLRSRGICFADAIKELLRRMGRPQLSGDDDEDNKGRKRKYLNNEIYKLIMMESEAMEKESKASEAEYDSRWKRRRDTTDDSANQSISSPLHSSSSTATSISTTSSSSSTSTLSSTQPSLFSPASISALFTGTLLHDHDHDHEDEELESDIFTFDDDHEDEYLEDEHELPLINYPTGLDDNEEDDQDNDDGVV